MTRLAVRSLLALAVALLAAAGLAACGGSSEEDVDQALKQTFGGGAKKVSSGKLRVSFKLDAERSARFSGPIALTLSGPFTKAGEGKLPVFDFKLGVAAGGQNFDAGAKSTGTKGFLTFQGQTFDIGQKLYGQFEKSYTDAEKNAPEKKGGGPSFASFGIDPRRWLKEASDEGTEDVGGAKVTHISGDIDVPRFLDDVNKVLGQAGKLGVTGQGQAPERLTDAQRKQIADAVKSAKVDLWTGEDDHILRRLSLKVDLDVPKAQQAAVGIGKGTIGFDLSISDVNAPQQIAAPANARPLSELTDALKTLQGSAASGSSSGSSSSGGSSPSGSSSPGGSSSGGSQDAAGTQEYLNCLQRANGAAAEVQKCASLLGS